MGSHGGAPAAGQTQVLANYGVTPELVCAPGGAPKFFGAPTQDAREGKVPGRFVGRFEDLVEKLLPRAAALRL